MASKTNQGYNPVAPIDWKNLLQSLTGRIEKLEADHNQPPEIDAKSKAGRIANYIADLEHCLFMTNSAISYYETLTENYDRLVCVLEESRNHAYDSIGELKSAIDIYKKNKPLIYAGEDQND